MPLRSAPEVAYAPPRRRRAIKKEYDDSGWERFPPLRDGRSASAPAESSRAAAVRDALSRRRAAEAVLARDDARRDEQRAQEVADELRRQARIRDSTTAVDDGLSSLLAIETSALGAGAREGAKAATEAFKKFKEAEADPEAAAAAAAADADADEDADAPAHGDDQRVVTEDEAAFARRREHWQGLQVDVHLKGAPETSEPFWVEFDPYEPNAAWGGLVARICRSARALFSLRLS